MNKKLLMGFILAVLSIGTMADSPSFDYFEGGYANWNADNSDNVGGIEVRMNYRIFSNFYLAGYHAAFLEKDFDNDITTFGIGYIFDLSSNTSFFVEANYALFHVDGGFDHEGYEFSSGIRSMLTKQIEIKVAIEKFDLFDDGTDGDSLDLTSVVLGAAYDVNDSTGVYADFKAEPDVNRFDLGMRFNF